MRRAVLFDLDGTLIYSSKAIRSSISQVLQEYGHGPLNDDNVKYFVGVPLAQALSHWTDDPKPMMDRYREIYMSCYKEMSYVFEGIPELLENLQGRAELAIITLKGNPQAEQVLSTFGLGQYFANIYGDDGPGEARYPIKPDPRHFYFALMDMKLITQQQHQALREEDDLRGRDAPYDNSNIFFVGDTGADMIGAARAGLRGIGATWGLRTRQQLEEAGAYRTADSPSDLQTLLEDLLHL